MAVIRVNKTRDYTVMSNCHLRDKRMSLKAKGLLSMMLSLPDEWDYSIAGLVAICKEEEAAMKSALKELKQTGYLIITKKKPNQTESGRFEYEYNIYEQPQEVRLEEKQTIGNQPSDKQAIEKQGVENQPLEIQPIEIQEVENPGQLNIDKLNTEESITNKSITDEEVGTDTNVPTTPQSPEKGKGKGGKPKPVRHKYGEYQHVLLSDEDVAKLKAEYGEQLTDEAVVFLDEYIEMKGYKAKNHYLAIRKWVIDAVKEKRQKEQRRYNGQQTTGGRGVYTLSNGETTSNPFIADLDSEVF